MKHLRSKNVFVFTGCLALGVGMARAGQADRPSRGHFVKFTSESWAASTRLGLSPIQSFDYGTFRWVELSPADFSKLAITDDQGIEDHTNRFALTLGGVTFDPLTQNPEMPAAWASTQTSGTGLQLIQFIGPIRDEWLDRVRAEGLRVVQYIHPYTYVVWGDSAAAEHRRSSSETRWTGPFLAAYKVQPQWRALPADSVDLHVTLYHEANTVEALRELEGLGAKLDSSAPIDETFEIARLMLPGDKMAQAAAIAGVYSMRPIPTDGGLRGEMSDQINVGNYNGSNVAFPGYATYLAGLGLDGSGVIIANVDGGVQNNHPDLQNRFVACAGTTCGGAAVSSHGTHTAGIMAADGSSGTMDGLGFKRGLGMAPGANLVEQVYSPFFTNPGGMLLLMTDSYANGAKLSGNSWGPAGTPQGYDDDTRQVDVGVRDASAAAGNQGLTYVLSFMNGNGGTSTQGSPDEAKNIFAIGSTKMQTSGGAQILQIDDVSSNSAHGPALDGRTIPHMVAPGCYVDSTYTTSTYSLLCGTSMASPHVSGAVALFIDYYRGLPTYTVDPSPALVKAAFLPVAHDLSGHLDASGGVLGHPFDSKQGWGRMDTAAVIAPTVSVRYFDQPVVLDNTGEQWVVNVAAADPSKPLKMMLVWTDAPGHGLGGSTPAWNNDLDLVVEDGVNTYRGNVFAASGWSTTGGVADNKNNTEGVFIGPTSAGSFTVRVIASNINSDGVPSLGDATDQDFALVCYNCAQNPGFTLTVTPGSQDICLPANAVYNVNVGQIMGFTDPVTLSLAGQPGSATVTFGTNPVTTPGSTTLTLSDMSHALPGTYNMTLTGTSGALTRNAAITMQLFNGVPDAPLLTSPADGTINVALQPPLTWTPAIGAQTHEVQVATDAAFSNVVASASGLAASTFTPASALAPGTVHYWRVRSTNACGVGSFSSPRSFTTRFVPAILLVDDDDNAPDVRSYYTTALTALGWDYDVWDTGNTDNEPSAAQLAPYQAVIWFTGDEFGGVCGPGAAGEAALGTWLSTGRCFFLSSQDYLYDRGGTGHNVPTSFMQLYLGVTNPSTSDVSQTTVTGGAGSAFAGLGPYALSYPFTNYSDALPPLAPAIAAFAGNAGVAAIQKNTLVYRTVFLGFPLEAISSATDRQSVLSRFLANCQQSCPIKGDMTATNGVNGSDIAAFTSCFIGGTPLASGCSCADMDANGFYSTADITLFVNCLLGLGCP